MTDTEIKIINLIRKSGGMMLAGNREFYEGLEIKNEEFILYGGDTVSNTEEYRHRISDEEALEKICNYYRDKAYIFGSNKVLTPEEIYAYMIKNLNI
ncbi:MAG: hypothetical protein ACJ75J_13395 [Cytophagaceae bacterium]